MQIPTHIAAGWIIGNAFALAPKQRLACMVLATIPDLDGIGLFWSRELYLEYHHHYGHTVVLGFLAALCTSAFFRRKLLTFSALYLSFLSHLAMDSFGSGHGWGLALLWPISDRYFLNPYAWDFSGWQNILATLLALALTLDIFRRTGRTPFELLWPRLDRFLRGRYFEGTRLR